MELLVSVVAVLGLTPIVMFTLLLAGMHALFGALLGVCLFAPRDQLPGAVRVDGAVPENARLAA